MAADRRGAEPQRQEPRPARRGVRRLRLPQGGHRRDGRRRQPGEGRLHPADDLRRPAPPGRAARRRPRSSSTRPSKLAEQPGGSRADPRRADQGVPGDRNARRADRRAAEGTRRRQGRDRRPLAPAGPLLRGEPAGRQGDRGDRQGRREGPEVGPGPDRRGPHPRGAAATCSPPPTRTASSPPSTAASAPSTCTAVAKLEQRLGRREQALQAGRDLLAASPGQPGGLQVLRRPLLPARRRGRGAGSAAPVGAGQPVRPAGAASRWPTPSAERLRQGEAIELLWRAFEKTNELEGKLGVIDRLTAAVPGEQPVRPAAGAAGARAARGRQGPRDDALPRPGVPDRRRPRHRPRSSSNGCSPRTPATRTCSASSSTLCETGGRHRRGGRSTSGSSTPPPRTTTTTSCKLAQLLTRAGESDEAADIWVKLVAGETEPHRNLPAIDQLITAGKHDAALAILTPDARPEAGRLGTALPRRGGPGRPRASTTRPRPGSTPILAMKLPDDELGEIAKNQIKQAKKKATAAAAAGPAGGVQPVRRRFDESTLPAAARAGRRTSTRSAPPSGWTRATTTAASSQPFYAPSDFGEARMACLGWLYEFARAKDDGRRLRQGAPKTAKDKAGADPRPLWDWFYLQTLRQRDDKDMLPTALALSKGTDPAGLLAYLNAVAAPRDATSAAAAAPRRRRPRTPPRRCRPTSSTTSLACYRKLKQAKPDWVTQRRHADRHDRAEAGEAGPTRRRRSTRRWSPTRRRVDKVQAALGAGGRAQRPRHRARPVRQAREAPGAGEDRRRRSPSCRPGRRATLLDDLDGQAGRGQEVRRRAEGARPVPVDRPPAEPGRPADRVDHAGGRSRRPDAASTSTPARAAAERHQITFPSPNEYYDDGSHQRCCTTPSTCTRRPTCRPTCSPTSASSSTPPRAPSSSTSTSPSATCTGGPTRRTRRSPSSTEAVAGRPGRPQPAAGSGVAARAEQRAGRGARAARLDHAARHADDAAARGGGPAAGRAHRQRRPRPAGGRPAVRPAARRRQAARTGRQDAPPRHARRLAETVLGRAQRQAGNKTSTLVRLMTQYQSQNQTDLAVQIARQILRKGPSSNFEPVPRRATRATAPATRRSACWPAPASSRR